MRINRILRSLAALAFTVTTSSAAGETDVSKPSRVLVFGDSNSWGYVARADGGPTTRYPRDQRWTGILDRLLGPNTEVIENGLNLRTTDLDGENWPDSIIEPETFNGRRALPEVLAANMPLDLVIIMLGTNDLQARYARSAPDIAEEAVSLALMVESSQGGIGTSYPAPKVLVMSPVMVAPIPIAEWAERYRGAQLKSSNFPDAFAAAANREDIALFDAANAIGGTANGADGLHMSPRDHQILAKSLAPVVSEMLATDRQAPSLANP